jgi:Caspase domain/Domain of unknown function (DUF4384)
MFRVKRRQLLQFFGSAVATLGLSQFEIQQQALRFAKVLAQETPRKRALLIGINRYDDPEWHRLYGAVNDTQLQKELLIHRFGFDPSNIFVLVDKEATRENILHAFEENLIKWAKPGDVVVFHFSGHGSQVADPDKVFEDGRVSTIVPINSSLPREYLNQGGRVNDITGHTLWLLMKAINTDNVTFVLDSCHSGGARNGLLTVRSRPGDQELIRGQDSTIQLLASQEEQEYQQQLLSRLKLTPAEFAAQRKQGVPKGIMLAAAHREQEAIDAPFADTYAGIFTYVLTRYLWQQASSNSASTMMASAATTTQRILQEYFPSSGRVQQPEFNVHEGSNLAQQAVYFLSSRNPPAEAVITKVKGNQVDLFLGGIEPRSLEAFGRGATFTLANGQGQVQIVSRDQFTAKGTVIQAGTRGAITPGNLLQESSRAIPSDLALRIGLDPSLGQELPVAKQELLIIKRIEPVSTQQPDLHYILGRITSAYRQQLQRLKVKNVPEVDSIALFSPAADLIPSSAGAAGEDVASAVKRLKAKLKSLLAARLVKLTLNTTSSRLNVAAALQRVEGGQIQAEAFTVRGKSITPLSQTRGQTTRSANAQHLTPGSLVQFLIQNNESRDLYVSVLLISVDGELLVLSPLPGNEDAPPVRAGQQIQVPDPDRGERYQFKIAGEPGMAEALVIASTTPLKRAISLLQTLAAETNRSRGPVNLDKEPDAAIASLLVDLDEGTRSDGVVAIPGVQQLDTKQMAALSITFEVASHDS